MTNEDLQLQLTREFWTKHPQFPGGTRAAQDMTERVAELVDTGKPLNLATMDEAYRQLLVEGRLITEAQAQRMSDKDLLQVVRDSGAEV